MIRPSLPVPAMEAEERLFSANIFCAAGMAKPAAEVLAGATATDAGAGVDAGAGAALAGAALATAAVSIFAINCSATTVAPSIWMISVRTPEAGAGTSSTTLSVSISIKISSAVTASPAFFFH